MSILAQLAAGLVFSAPVLAASITVTTTFDLVNPADSPCTLREAVIAANTKAASCGITENFTRGANFNLTLGGGVLYTCNLNRFDNCVSLKQ